MKHVKRKLEKRNFDVDADKSGMFLTNNSPSHFYSITEMTVLKEVLDEVLGPQKPKLEWSSESPKVDGFYLIRNIESYIYLREIRDGKVYKGDTFAMNVIEYDRRAQWLGPIELPDEPKKATKSLLAHWACPNCNAGNVDAKETEIAVCNNCHTRIHLIDNAKTKQK